MLKLKSVNFEQQDFRDHTLKSAQPGQLEWLVGRKPTCDLVLPCPEVSRIHGRIVYQNDAYFFMDVGSTCGSILNGESVANNEPRPLSPGDLLQLGKTFLYIQEVAPPVAPLLTPTLAPQAQTSAWTNADLVCRCCRIVDETPDVKTFYFAAEPPILFDYLPGQFVTVSLEIAGKKVMRPYSISASPTRPHHLSITVKRVPSPKEQPDLPAGVVSNWLHDHLHVGDRMTLVGGPMGAFTCAPEVPEKVLLLSAGSGISPMMSMARWIHDTLIDCDVTFFHSARTVEDIAFRAELQAMAAQMPNFHLVITVTQLLSQQPWMGLTGRMSPSMLNLVAPDLRDRTVYVCGPDGFMQSVRSMLEQMDFPMQNYHEESFGGPSIPAAQPQQARRLTILEEPPTQVDLSELDDARSVESSSSPEIAPVVTFSESQQTVSTDGNESVLELAEQAGVSLRSACRAGVCGACKVRTNNGRVRYNTPPMALAAADKEAGCVLACVAYPVSDLEVAA